MAGVSRRTVLAAIPMGLGFLVAAARGYGIRYTDSK
jgi:hypothetical protein